MQSFAMPRRSVKKNILEAQEQFKSNYLVLIRNSYSLLAHYCHKSLWFVVRFLLDRKPGDIEVLTDLVIENYKNFPEARQLGEESARFIRQEMEATWGQSHLTVLSEDEAQHWLLGVGGLFLFRIKIHLDPFQNSLILQDCISF